MRNEKCVLVKDTFGIDYCGVALGKGKSEAITTNLAHVLLFDDKLKEIYLLTIRC